MLGRLADDTTDGAPWSAPAALAVAELELARGEPRAALNAVAPYVDGSMRTLRGPLISVHLLAAVAARAVSDSELEMRSLEHALALAEEDGFRSRFTAPAIRPLLAAQLGRATAHRPFIAELMDTQPGPVSRQEPGLGAPVESLSQRERVVLRYLPSRLSAAEIADELYVSVHTVNTHMRQIYRKVQATNRREAVDRGRSLGLL